MILSSYVFFFNQDSSNLITFFLKSSIGNFPWVSLSEYYPYPQNLGLIKKWRHQQSVLVLWMNNVFLTDHICGKKIEHVGKKIIMLGKSTNISNSPQSKRSQIKYVKASTSWLLYWQSLWCLSIIQILNWDAFHLVLIKEIIPLLCLYISDIVPNMQTL